MYDEPLAGVSGNVELTKRFAERRAERKALALALAYARADPFYEGRPITAREEALMHLALRCLHEPERTRLAIFGWDYRIIERRVLPGDAP